MSSESSSSSSSAASSNVRLALTIIAIAGVLAAIAFAWLNERGEDAVIARLGDQELTASDMRDMLESAPGDVPVITFNGTTGKTTPANIMTVWLRVASLRAELEEVGYGSTDQDEAEAKLGFADQDLDLTSAYGMAELATARELRALERYAADAVDPDTLGAPEYLCASHILLDSEQDALDIITLLEDGRDFAELAMEFSTGPSGPGGGDLSCGPTARYVPEFSDGARASGVGISAPVRSDFGFHVIQVRSIGPLSVEAHPEMDPVVVESILENLDMSSEIRQAEIQVSDALIQDAFTRLVDVYVDPRYGYWDAANQSVLPIRG